MGAMASQITSLTFVYSTVWSGADQWKHQSSASLAFRRGIHRWQVNSPHKWPVTWKMFPIDDVVMTEFIITTNNWSVTWLCNLCQVIRRKMRRTSVFCAIILYDIPYAFIQRLHTLILTMANLKFIPIPFIILVLSNRTATIYITPLVSIYFEIRWSLHSQCCKLISPRAAYMRQWTGSSLVEILACRLFGAKLLLEPSLTWS